MLWKRRVKLDWALWFFAVGAHACLALFLSRSLGWATGIALYTFIVAMLMGLAGQLLRGASVGEISWRNRAAILLLPASKLVGSGGLTEFLIKNGLASIALGISCVVADRLQVFGGRSSPGDSVNGIGTGWGSGIVYWLTIACWLIWGSAWLRLIQVYVQRHQQNLQHPDQPRDFRITMAVWLPPCLLLVSVLCRTWGYTWAALAIASLPLLVIAAPVFGMCAVAIAYQLLGKPIRWN